MVHLWDPQQLEKGCGNLENLKKKFTFILFLIFVAISLLPEIQLVEAPTISVTNEFLSQGYDGYNGAGSTVYATARDLASANWTAPSYNSIWLGQQLLGGDYEIYRSYLFFDTSTIPDNATITSAKLRLHLFSLPTDDFNITIQNGQPTYPNVPFVAADYNRLYYSGDGGQMNTSVAVDDAYNNITVTSTGLTWISQTARSKLTLRSSNDIGNNAPTGDELLGFYASEQGSGYQAILEVTYSTDGYLYVLNGAYDEDGLRGSPPAAINCTFFRETEAPQTFELNGTYNVTAVTSVNLFEFDLGYNESRTYYVYQTYEEIYVMTPADPYYTYYFTIVDYIGLEWGYLESLVNINGTDRVCERVTIEIVNNLPFTFTWGESYKMRLVCNLGEYTFGSYIAGATTEFTLTVTKDMFPEDPTHIGDITVSATRENASWIQVIYIDGNSSTNWVNFTFYEYGNTTFFHSYNTTSNSVTYNWYDGMSTINYYVIISASHSNLGMKYWTFTCPAPSTTSANPFGALGLLGDFPFAANQIPAVLIIMVVAAVFSWWNIPMGIIATVIVSFILAWLGWLAVGWTWLTLAGSMGFILAIAMMKDRERSI